MQRSFTGMKFLARLEKSRHLWFLTGVSVVFLLLRLPSLFEPNWYGDEGIYQTIGLAVSRGRMLYSQIWDNKPPLLYLVYALFAGDQFATRFASLLVGLLSVWIFYLIATRLFYSLKSVFLSTGLFVFFYGIPFMEGNIANAENFMQLPTFIAALLIISVGERIQKNHQHQQHLRLFCAGFLLSIAFLFKIVAVFDATAFGLFLLILSYRSLKKIPSQIWFIIPYVGGFLIPLTFTALFFLVNGAFSDFYTGSFKQMVGYVGYGNAFIFAQGLLVIKLGVLVLTVVILFLKRRLIAPSLLFVYLWVAFSTFNAFFAQRPYTHYVLVLLPSLILFVTTVLHFKSTATRSNKVEFCVLLVLLFLIISNFNFYQKTYPYYRNFVEFVAGRKSMVSYFSFFDHNTPKDYELARFIKSSIKKDDTIFIWGNNAQVYKMTGKLPPGRYTVAYHMSANKNTLAETYKDILKVQPRYIIVTSPQNPLPYQLPNYKQTYVIESSVIYERVF